MNRLKDYFTDPLEPHRLDDFYEIESRFDSYVVSERTAKEIERRLDRWLRPRWIAFRDLTGARHRILSASVTGISESRAAHRVARREFHRARRLEEKQDRRPWEEDD